MGPADRERGAIRRAAGRGFATAGQALGGRAAAFVAVAGEAERFITDLAEAEELADQPRSEAGIGEVTAGGIQELLPDLLHATGGMLRDEGLDALPVPGPAEAMRGHHHLVDDIRIGIGG